MSMAIRLGPPWPPGHSREGSALGAPRQVEGAGTGLSRCEVGEHPHKRPATPSGTSTQGAAFTLPLHSRAAPILPFLGLRVPWPPPSSICVVGVGVGVVLSCCFFQRQCTAQCLGTGVLPQAHELNPRAEILARALRLHFAPLK